MLRSELPATVSTDDPTPVADTVSQHVTRVLHDPDPATIDAFMADGAARASEMAEATMRDVRRIVGFIR